MAKCTTDHANASASQSSVGATPSAATAQSQPVSAVGQGPIRAALFDFDGTLAELTLDFALLRQKVAAISRIFLEDDDGGSSAVPSWPDGQPVLERVDELAALIGARSGRDLGLEFHTRCRFLITDMEIKAAAKGRLFPFSRALLAGLRAQGIRLGVVTRNCTAAVKMVYPEIEQAVDCFLPREAVTLVKPNPQHVADALNCLGVRPENALMVGDHPMDIMAGLAAGTRTAGVASGRRSEAELSAAGANYTASDCAALFSSLAALGVAPWHDAAWNEPGITAP